MARNRDVKLLWSALCILCALFTVVCVFGACGEKVLPPAEQAKAALSCALDSLHARKFNGYMAAVDLGTEIDEEHRAIMLDLLCQHQERQEVIKGGVLSCIVVDACEESDTVVTVYYEMTFGNGATEVCSQKMVRRGGEWKIWVRN